MKKRFFLICFFVVFLYGFAEETVTTKDGRSIILYDDHSWREVSNNKDDKASQYRKNLRQGVKASEEEIAQACEMYMQGWRYTMPEPKSKKAAWGNYDRRTTWFRGWWYNEKTKQYSDTTPKKAKNGLYLGDNQNNAYSWTNGGSPAYPDVYMYLLSSSGGPSNE